MTKIDVIRALKDVEYRESLTVEERAMVPYSQAGMIELDGADLESVSGGAVYGSYSCTKSTGGGCSCTCS